MWKLEIILTEEQYQHIQEEVKYSNRVHLSEGVFGGYEICLSVGIPIIFPATLNVRTYKSMEIGEVEWKFLNAK